MSEIKHTTLRDILTETECQLIDNRSFCTSPGNFIISTTPIHLLRWWQVEDLGLLFIGTTHKGVSPGGPLVVIGAEEIMRRMVVNDIPFKHVTFPIKG
jgi:hypothetical protein